MSLFLNKHILSSENYDTYSTRGFMKSERSNSLYFFRFNKETITEWWVLPKKKLIFECWIIFDEI
uniref:Uncharacterized protein n=1 Tax=viral metagenome TaxID=1070528 RepID=A0A6C0AEA1_9ZZZZ